MFKSTKRHKCSWAGDKDWADTKSGDKTLNVFDFVQLSKNIDKTESRSENKIYLALLEKFLATSPYREKTANFVLCRNSAFHEIAEWIKENLGIGQPSLG